MFPMENISIYRSQTAIHIPLRLTYRKFFRFWKKIDFSYSNAVQLHLAGSPVLFRTQKHKRTLCVFTSCGLSFLFGTG